MANPSAESENGRDPDSSAWPVLVTGAGGFVGGHIARNLASAGHSVRGLARRSPAVQPGDPAIEWLIGDLTDAAVRARALAGVRGVIHSAGWVSLGPDKKGLSNSVNVDLTGHLLDEALAAGVERFVYTSSLYTLAAGTREQSADEFTGWNLERIESSYMRSKRAAERMVLAASGPRLTTIALCPGMVLGSRDLKPTSTQIVLAFSRTHVAIVPRGGIPIIDASLLAVAHRRSLIAGQAGQRYAVVGPYVSYRELARLVNSICGKPRWVIPLPDRLESLVVPAAGWFGPIARLWWPDVSPQLAAGGFLCMHVKGDRADACFGLKHPPARETIASSL
jgi:dihydroflavonol-4-reductase